LGIIVSVLATLVLAFNLLLRFGLSSVERVQATYLAEEGIEALKHIRDDDYTILSALTRDTAYYLEYTNDHWSATTTGVAVDGVFERSFMVSDVDRDSNDDIADTGTTDDNTLLLTVEVSWWNRDATTTKSIATYVTNIYNDE
jgi:hypothetical protein